MKRVVKYLLLALCLCFVLAGCGKKEEVEDTAEEKEMQEKAIQNRFIRSRQIRQDRKRCRNRAPRAALTRRI